MGDTLTTYRAHQGDLRLDWSASANDKLFARFSFVKLHGRDATEARSPFLRDPQRPALLERRRQLEPHLRAVGHQRGPRRLQQHHRRRRDLRLGRDRRRQRDLRDRRRPADRRPELDRVAATVSPLPGAIATDSDTLAKTYQINEKLTWLKGRHALKFGGQFLRYDQQRFYAGNNGLLGFITFNGGFTGAAFSDFLLDQVSGKGRGGGDPDDPWTHLQNRIALFVQDDFKVTPDLTLNLGLRWAYTSPLVEKDNRQSNFDVAPPFGNGTGVQTFAKDGSLEDRALYKPYYKGFEPRVGVAWSASDRLVLRGGYGISQFMEGTGANLRLPLNPPFFFESNVNYDRTTGAGRSPPASRTSCPGTTPTGNVRAYDPNLRPQFTHQWNAFVEYRVTAAMSAQVGYVGHHANHLVTPTEGNQALPGVGDPATWAPRTRAGRSTATQPLITTIATTTSLSRQQVQLAPGERPPARRGTASSSWPRTRSPRVPTNNRGFYGVFGAPAVVVERHGRRLLAEHLRPRGGVGPDVPRRPPQLHLLGQLRAALGQGAEVGLRLVGRHQRDPRRLEAGRHLPGAHRPPRHRHRRPQPLAAGRARRRAAELRRRLEALEPDRHRGLERAGRLPLARHQRLRRWRRSARSATARSASARAPGYSNVDLVLSKRFDVGGPRYLEFRVEAFNALNHPNFGPPARDISRRQHVRPDHEHGQHPARDRAGAEVLLLGSAARPDVGSRFGAESRGWASGLTPFFLGSGLEL